MEAATSTNTKKAHPKNINGWAVPSEIFSQNMTKGVATKILFPFLLINIS
jgi:hypothetical protein